MSSGDVSLVASVAGKENASWIAENPWVWAIVAIPIAILVGLTWRNFINWRLPFCQPTPVCPGCNKKMDVDDAGYWDYPNKKKWWWRRQVKHADCEIPKKANGSRA